MSRYLETLNAMASKGTGARAGSSEERDGLKRFEDLFSELSESRIREKVRDVYAADVYFNDTLKEIQGIDALELYLIESARAVELCTVDVQDVASHEGNYYVRWVMDIRFKRLKRGETTRSIGVSHLRLDAEGKVALHQDYWDSASGLFEHVPVIGYGIRAIKARV